MSILNTSVNVQSNKEIISLENFDVFINKVYDDILKSYYSLEIFKKNEEKKEKKENENINNFYKRIINAKDDAEKEKVFLDIKKAQNKALYLRMKNIIINQPEISGVQLDELVRVETQKKISLQEKIYEKINVSKYLDNRIEKFIKNGPSEYLEWVEYLKSLILEMSEAYTQFKDIGENKASKEEINKKIKTTFHALRSTYSEIIELVRRNKHEDFLHILDDIFLRVFQWVDKEPDSKTDSVLLRNAFSHFNVVYDKQSFKSCGEKFKKKLLKLYSKAQIDEFEKSLQDGYYSIHQRIILFNSKSDKNVANAILDTNIYHLCRYFMTFCHCLYALYTNTLSKVPFSKELLNSFGKTYGFSICENNAKIYVLDKLKISEGYIYMDKEEDNICDVGDGKNEKSNTEKGPGEKDNMCYVEDVKNEVSVIEKDPGENDQFSDMESNGDVFSEGEIDDVENDKDKTNGEKENSKNETGSENETNGENKTNGENETNGESEIDGSGIDKVENDKDKTNGINIEKNYLLNSKSLSIKYNSQKPIYLKTFCDTLIMISGEAKIDSKEYTSGSQTLLSGPKSLTINTDYFKITNNKIEINSGSVDWKDLLNFEYEVYEGESTVQGEVVTINPIGKEFYKLFVNGKHLKSTFNENGSITILSSITNNDKKEIEPQSFCINKDSLTLSTNNQVEIKGNPKITTFGECKVKVQNYTNNTVIRYYQHPHSHMVEELDGKYYNLKNKFKQLFE